MRIETILHPTDFSDTAEHARDVAVELATRHGAVLHLFHALLLHGTGATEPPLADAVAAATEHASRLVAQDPTRRQLVVRGSHLKAVSAFEGIIDRAAELQPDLIVMGTHGRHGLGRLLIGSTAEKVLRHAPGHVVTVRRAVPPRTPGAPSRILVPVDFSDGSAQALDAARWLAKRDHAQLHLLHVVEPVPTHYYAVPEGGRLELDADMVERSLQEWSGDIEGARWSVTMGSAPIEIARVAKNASADLVVMGTRGLTGLAHLVIGSVTERVCRSCDAPVLTIRAT